jgi:hypothetical protein
MVQKDNHIVRLLIRLVAIMVEDLVGQAINVRGV